MHVTEITLQPMAYAHAAIFTLCRLSYRIWSLARRHFENSCGRYNRFLPFFFLVT